MAFLAPAVWEVRTTGNAANGGAFDPVSGVPGTDFSQQVAAQIAYTDMVIGATTTQFTSVLNSPVASLVGNFINVTGGAGFTVQRVQVISVAAGVATCDKSLGTTASTGGTGNMGGALTTIGAAAALVVAGNTIYVKATATYSVAATGTYSANGSAGLPILLIGYTTTRGDNGFVTVQSTAGSLTMFNITGANWYIKNFILDCNSQSVSRSILMSGAGGTAENCRATNFTFSGLEASSMARFVNCYATGGTSAASGGFTLSVTACVLVGCVAIANACPGFSSPSSATLFLYCISANNTGATTDGFLSSATAAINLVNCVSYGNGRDGLRLSNAAGATILVAVNCIFVNNGGYGINSVVTSWVTGLYVDYNFFYNNTSGARNQLPVGAHDVTGSGDPFTSSSNFALNNTAGAGAAARAVGFPGALQVGGTGFIDMGALQHQDSGGSSVVAVDVHNTVIVNRFGVAGY